ncbi:hypothetical protein [Williamsia serinedens]|uniref:hypothetical protein n=1 Tax=Williamsia serinedens TaxID=391736 RepID=UPI0020A49FE3|nr:hypothetical protein [Williamsia serinedens]
MREDASGYSIFPPDVEHWDYQTSLKLSSTISLEKDALTRDCGLDRGATLAAIVLAQSSQTKTERVVARTVLSEGHRDEKFEFRLSGDEIGGRLTLETVIAILDAKSTSAVAPVAKGSVIWRSKSQHLLEGIGSQFPTEALDFANLSGSVADAGWLLEVDASDFDAPFMSSVRLFLNTGSPAIKKMISGSGDSSSQQLLRLIDWDVSRQLVDIGLLSAEVEALDVDGTADSLAGVLRNIIGAIWPLESMSSLRRWRTQDKGRIESRLQSHYKVGRE